MTGIKIFDAHVHVDNGLSNYDLTVDGMNLIFNHVDAFQTFREGSASQSRSLILDIGDDFGYVCNEARTGNIAALKIHSRLQHITKTDWPAIETHLAQMPARLPIIIDAFYYGKDLDAQPSLRHIIHIAERFPDRHFVIAHSGGYHILEYFFHLREFTNISYDLSFSLQYLLDSSKWIDLRKLIKHTNKARILFGSDFPFASPKLQYQSLLAIADDLQLSHADRAAIFFENAYRLFAPDRIA